MIDSKQVEHFKMEKNRYEENLLFRPPLHTQEEVNHIIRELKQRNINKVVEFGSGNGRLTIPLLQNNIKVVAVDISTDSLHALSAIALRMNIKEDMLTTTYEIPSKLNHAVVGCDILHHIDLEKYLNDIHQKLQKKGIIIFSEPNILNTAWIFLITFAIDWKIEWRIIFCNYFNILRTLKKNKYKNIKIQGFGLIPPPLLNSFPTLQRINYFLGDIPILKLFAYRYLIFAEKC
jgi:SAM-dependent methyltransferase